MFRRFTRVAEKRQKNKAQIVSSSILLESLEPRILLSAEVGVPPQDLVQDVLVASTEHSVYEIEPVFDADQTAAETELNINTVYDTVDNVIGEASTVSDNETDTNLTAIDADTIASEIADTDADVDQEIIFTAQDLYQFTQQAGMQIVFIDPSVPDYESLLAQLPRNDTSSEFTIENNTDATSSVHVSTVTEASTFTYINLSETSTEELQTPETLQRHNDSNSIQVYVLDAEQDGVSQITNVLAQYEDIAAVHILSHGAAGYLRLGNNTVNNNNLNNYQSELRQWGSSLTEKADILLYGCDVADGHAGIDFITRISKLTGADVAASDDNTGGTTEGGDWLLEQSTGVIETASLINEAGDYHYLLADVVSTTASEIFFDTSTDDVYFFEDNWGSDVLARNINSAGIDTLNFSAVTTNLTFTIRVDGSINVTDGVNTLIARSIENIVGGDGRNDFVFEQDARLTGDLNGGTGSATLNYSSWTDAVNVNLQTGMASGVTGSVSNINNITGGSASDILIGDDTDNLIAGGAGDDRIYGRAGNDSLYGEADADRIYGEAGRDQIYGGEGNDILEGGVDNDTYFFEDNFGTDTVNDTGNEILNRATDSIGDSWDFSAVTTDMQFYFGSHGYLSGEITQAVSLDNSVKESYRNMFAVETLIGSSKADQFHIYQTADYGLDPDNNVLLLDGSDGSDTYTSYFAPTGIAVPMDVAIRDQGNIGDADKAVALGSDEADLLEVNQTSVDAYQSFTINAEADPVTMTPPLVTAGTDKQSFGYNVYGDQSGLESLEVIAKQGNDTVFIASTPSNMSAIINGNEGDDTFIVGRSIAGITATVDLIQGNDTTGDLIISGDEDRDTLLVDDSGDTDNNIANLSDSYISGLDMQVGIEYSNIETLGLALGQGNDSLTVTSTIGGASYITGNDGEDTLDIQSATGIVQVRGGNDNDVITLHSNNAASQVSLYGEDGNDILNIRRIDELVTVRGGNDNDTINVSSATPAVGGVVDYITDLLDADGEAG
ncbi:MAG: DUF4347 domain-containing protein, partial [Gammaproteobacteria bacterium]|nr:DUF4347 domain-containing protein [Gammaproteobacteria bacterium]